jgi:hypothetical protein
MNELMEERGMDYGDRADALLGAGPMALYQGAKQITGLGDQEANVQDIKDWRALAKAASMGEGKGLINAGTVGRIASDVGTLALPMGAAEQAAGKVAAHVLPQSAAKVTAASGVGAAEMAAQPVLEGESRAVNTGIGAVLPGAMSAGVQATRRATTGMFNTSDAAARLEMDSNITPTVGQSIEGGVPAKIIKNIEDYTEGIIPGVAGGRKRARQELFDAVGMDASPNKINFEGVPLIDTPNPHRVGSPEYFNALRNQFDEAYGKLLNDVELEAPGIIALVDEALESAGTEFDAPLRARLRRSLLEGIPEEGVGMVTGRQLKKLMSDASDGVSKATLGGDAGKNRSAIAMYNAVRDNLADLLERRAGPDRVSALRQLDQAYAERQVLEETAGNVFQTTPGELTAEALAATVRSRSTPSMLANQTGTAAQLSADATNVMRPARESMWVRTLGGLGLGAGVYSSPALTAGIALPLAGIVGVGSTKMGSKFFRGQLGNQQAIAKVMREIVEPKIGTASVLLTDIEE